MLKQSRSSWWHGKIKILSGRGADCEKNKGRTRIWFRRGLQPLGAGRWSSIFRAIPTGYSHRTKRIHHLLSDLEFAAFLLLDNNPSVTDIREQFPLIRDDTRDIARENNLFDPANNVPGLNIIELCKAIDRAHDLELLESLYDLRVLCASRAITFGVRKPFRKMSGNVGVH